MRKLLTIAFILFYNLVLAQHLIGTDVKLIGGSSSTAGTVNGTFYFDSGLGQFQFRQSAAWSSPLMAGTNSLGSTTTSILSTGDVILGNGIATNSTAGTSPLGNLKVRATTSFDLQLLNISGGFYSAATSFLSFTSGNAEFGTSNGSANKTSITVTDASGLYTIKSQGNTVATIDNLGGLRIGYSASPGTKLGTGSGNSGIIFNNTNDWTIPNLSSTQNFVGDAGTQTLTNKTLGAGSVLLLNSSVSISGSTFTLDAQSYPEAIFYNTTAITANCIVALSNTSNTLKLGFSFKLNGTNLTMTFPNTFTMFSNDPNWNPATQVYTFNGTLSNLFYAWEAKFNTGRSKWELVVSQSDFQ